MNSSILYSEKSYETLEEEERRFQVFIKNIKMIAEHNEWFRQGKKSFSMGINQFTDMVGGIPLWEFLLE